MPLGNEHHACTPRVRPANVTACRPGPLSPDCSGSTPSILAIPPIGSRDLVHLCTATTSTSPRFAQSARRSSPENTNRSWPLPAAAGEGGSVPAIVCQPEAGSTGRNRRWSFTKSWLKFQVPAFTSGSSTVHRSRPPSRRTCQPRITRPPLRIGRAPAAARMTVGARSVPESSGVMTTGSASSYRPSATRISTGVSRPRSAVRISRTRSSARRSVATGRAAEPSASSRPAGERWTSAADTATVTQAAATTAQVRTNQGDIRAPPRKNGEKQRLGWALPPAAGIGQFTRGRFPTRILPSVGTLSRSHGDESTHISCTGTDRGWDPRPSGMGAGGASG